MVTKELRSFLWDQSAEKQTWLKRVRLLQFFDAINKNHHYFRIQRPRKRMETNFDEILRQFFFSCPGFFSFGWILVTKASCSEKVNIWKMCAFSWRLRWKNKKKCIVWSVKSYGDFSESMVPKNGKIEKLKNRQKNHFKVLFERNRMPQAAYQNSFSFRRYGPW